MKLTVSFSELNNIIKQKFDLPISFSGLDESNIVMCYVPLNINIRLSIVGVESNILTLGFEGLNLKDNLALKVALPAIQKQVPEEIADILPKINKAFVSLRNINGLESLFDQLEITGVGFTDNSTFIDGFLK